MHCWYGPATVKIIVVLPSAGGDNFFSLLSGIKKGAKYAHKSGYANDL
jgi:hypothetical protein